MVLASEHYDEKDYIRNYQDFLSEVVKKQKAVERSFMLYQMFNTKQLEQIQIFGSFV